MGYSPKDIVDYVFEKGYEADFLTSLALHKGNYSIGEVGDKRFKEKDGKWKFISKMYEINVDINDDEIVTSAHNGLYISAFVSRMNDSFNLHFLVHQYPDSMKEKFDDAIAKEVVRYMITKTVLALRLDTPEKLEKYISK